MQIGMQSAAGDQPASGPYGRVSAGGELGRGRAEACEASVATIRQFGLNSDAPLPK